MVSERVPDLEGLLEYGNGEQSRQDDSWQPVFSGGSQSKEYILFVTDGSEEIQAAADYLREKISITPRQPKDRLELVVQSVPDFDSAIQFWKEFVLETLLVVADKRTRESTGVRFKIIQSDADHETYTGVVDAYTVRTKDGNAYKVTEIYPELLIQTIINLEVNEMRKLRMPLAKWDEGKKEAQRQKRRARIDQAVEALDRDARLGIAELASSEIRLAAVVRALQRHYGSQEAESLRLVELAGRQLDYLLKELPPGMLYVTHSSKEGVFGLQAALDGKGEGAPIYAVKRFKELAEAQHVDWLSKQLLSQRSERSEEVTYLNTPKTYWPLKVDGYSVVFMDPVVGETLITLMPKINQHIRQKKEEQEPEASAEAELLKDFILRASLDNVAYWQQIVPAIAQSIGYQPQPENIQTFISNAIRRSAEVLEALTSSSLSKESIESAAMAAAYSASHRYTIGLDSGPRNILVAEQAAGCGIDELIDGLKGPYETATSRRRALDGSKVADAIFQVDLPSEFKTVHQLRDFVRLVYAPSNELGQEEINRLFAYWLLRGERLRATTVQEWTPVIEDIYSVVNRVRESQRPTMVSKYLDEGPHDLEVAAVAEAARMSVIIPLVFLSKAKAQLVGELPTSMTTSELNNKFGELLDYNKQWARIGLTAASQLEGKLEGNRRYEIQGATQLFERWEKADIDPKKLPTFTPFMNV